MLTSEAVLAPQRYRRGQAVFMEEMAHDAERGFG